MDDSWENLLLNFNKRRSGWRDGDNSGARGIFSFSQNRMEKKCSERGVRWEDGGVGRGKDEDELCQLTHFINSFSVSSSCFCLSITFSMIARSSGVRCDKSGISAMTFGCGDHENLLPGCALRVSRFHFVSCECSTVMSCELHWRVKTATKSNTKNRNKGRKNPNGGLWGERRELSSRTKEKS
jgi:hypothetical protein